MSNFWTELKPGFTALAPMADVTDVAFRQMFAKYGRPDVMWTEFVSADGLFLAPEQGRDVWLPEKLRSIAVLHGAASDNPLLKDLIFSKLLDSGSETFDESPIVAQFFSRDPNRMKKAAELAVDLGYDGIDINMGCPARVIVNQGAGCAMIKDPETAKEVIEATIAGAAGRIPVSVKTRVGFNRDDEREDWFRMLLGCDIAALTLHARTRKDMSKVPARWDNVAYLVSLRNQLNPNIKILGNGDVSNLEEAADRVTQTKADGIMIGRGIFGNPWLFNPEVQKMNIADEKILATLLEHSLLFDRYLGDTKSFSLMRKHYKSYLRDTDLDKELKTKFMNAASIQEVRSLVESIL